MQYTGKISTLLIAAAIGLGTASQAAAECEATPAPLGQCKACHELAHGKPAKVTGPNISAVYGAKAEVSPDFAYSPAIKMAAEKGLVWTEENLNLYLADQKAFLNQFNGEELPHKMVLLTLKDDTKRANVINALKAWKECK